MLFARVEGRAFQLPGGDGLIVMIAGGWSALLIFYRLLDKPSLHGTQRITATVGVEWGIFIALLLAIGLAYAGTRMRSAQRASAQAVSAGGPEPWPPEGELGGAADATEREEPTVRIPPPRVAAAATLLDAPQEPGEGRPRYPPAPQEQLPFEDPRPGSE